MGINLLAANTNTIVLICMAVLFVIGLVFIIIWTVSAHKKKTQYMYWNSSTFGQSTNSSAHQLTVVTCPKCGSKNFEFVSEYARSLIASFTVTISLLPIGRLIAFSLQQRKIALSRA